MLSQEKIDAHMKQFHQSLDRTSRKISEEEKRVGRFLTEEEEDEIMATCLPTREEITQINE